MGNLDLDNILDETRMAMKTLSEIDVDDKYAGVSIGKIMAEIESKMESMTDDNGHTISKVYVKINTIDQTKKIQFFRKFDNKLRKLTIYETTIRPKLRGKVGSLLNKKVINGKELLKFEDEEFVDVVYRSLLQREADESSKTNALKFLRNTGNDKVDLIGFIINSEEGSRKQIRVKGIKSKQSYLLIKRAAYRIPILGYCIQLVINLCLLPKRLKAFQSAFDDLYNHIRLLNERSFHIEQYMQDYQSECSRRNKEIAEFQRECNKKDILIGELQSECNKKNMLIEEILHNKVIQEKEKINKLKIEKGLMDRFYLRYNEVLMPDSREEVKNRARIYIDKIEDWFNSRRKNELIIVDLGCGECEWIELLSENGFNSKGIDSNAYVVKKVREILPAIDIEEIDAFSYLKSMKDNSIDLLTSFHMVEHLEMIEIIELLSECKRVLKSEGMLIMETPNPQNILTSTYYFNMDPTHKKPIPPELLSFFIAESGLSVKEKVLLYPLKFVPYEYKDDDPIKDIVFRFNMEQAYSVLAVKE